MLKFLVDNTIQVTRGDSAPIVIDLYSDYRKKVKYEMEYGDELKLTVKENVNYKTPLIEKYFSEYLIELQPEDTKHLPFGKYVYDVQLKFADGRIHTVIKPSVFEICSEVGD